ncbi:ankyrin repeat-containing domain protein [Parachaetomium inaequale]|uniref:Ankyrin repeat-containing domain protein n=1 Tax=Parachaetomium inaequale TaxID=2588326 RepID=A0AAN6PB87_9PEZI|nr:ankyrin repeat-containing domain protein [Parachaetomium inaequale]
MGNHIQHLEELTKPLASGEFINPTPAGHRNGRGPLNVDKDFYAIVNDEDFGTWLKPQSGLDALRIAGPSDWRLRDLCKSLALSDYAEDYEVLHIDCDNLGHECRQEEGYGKGNTLIGPFLLRIFKFVLDSWAKRCANGGALVKDMTTHLLQGIVCTSEADFRVGESSKGDGDALLQSVPAIERLGSNLVQVLDHALMLGPKTEPSVVKSTKLMILLSGFHSFKESPELGRLIHCVRELHQAIAKYGPCKILFTHDERKHLKGLLGDVAGISNDEMLDCLSSLKCTNSGRAQGIEARHERTLEWLWDDDAFKTWKERDSSDLLLLFGKPASGKSVLSQFAADKLHTTGDKAVVASFFFRAGGPEELRTSRAMLQELLYKMLGQNRSFFPHFQRRFRKLRAEQGTATTITWQEDDLVDVLQDLQRHPVPGRVYALVDGLDESKDPSQSAEVLIKLARGCEGGRLQIKLFVATQRDGAAERALTGPFKSVSIHTIILEERNTTDIREYSRPFLAESLTGQLGWEREKVEKTLGIIVDRSQGIFLWPKLAKEQLMNDFLDSKREASIAEVKAFLCQVNPDIEKLYEKLFDRLAERAPSQTDRSGHMRKVGRMFQIVMQAKRPLLLEEFCDVYSLPPSDQDPGPIKMDELRPTNIAKVIAAHTANFLEVNKVTGTVNFLHTTASSFLQSRPDIHGVRSTGAATASHSSSDELPVMGVACIWYLRKASLDLEKLPTACSPRNMPVDGVNAFADKINEYPLLAYALEHTSSHLSCQQKPHLDAMQRLSKDLESSPLRFFLSEWMERQAHELGIPAPPAPPKNCDAFRNGVLHCAASQHLTVAVKMALAAGADADSQSKLHKSRENAMCLAIMSSRGEPSAALDEVARVLLEQGNANPNAPTRFQGTPLHYAGKYMQEGVVRLLLSHHASVHARDAQDMTPLHRTIIGLAKLTPRLEDAEGGNGDDVGNGRLPGTPLLLRPPRAAVPGATGELGSSPSREQHHHHLLQVRPNGTLPRDVSLRCVELLLEAGANPRAADRQGQKPIHWAAALRDREDIVKALLDAVAVRGSKRRRAADERCLEKGTTPLHWASGYGNRKVVNLLLQEGARADLADNRGKTAINWAARYGHAEILAALLGSIRKEEGRDLRAAVNMQEKRAGRHALIWACQKGHRECARLLIEAGADVNLAEGGDDDAGGTALSWAITFGHMGIVQLLVQKGATCSEGEGKRPVLGWAAASGNVDVFETLLEKWRTNHVLLYEDEPDAKGCSPFMLAAARGHVDMLRYLCENYSIDTNRWDAERNTALLLAAGWGQLEAVQWLVGEARLNINWTNMYGDTALHRAANWGRVDVIHYLLSQGAQPGLQNAKGKTYKDLEAEYKWRNEQMGLGRENGGGLLYGEEDEEEEDKNGSY